MTPGSATQIHAPAPGVRHGVRALLLGSPAYQTLEADERREMAQALVRVCSAAVSLGQQAPEGPKPLALAQSAQGQFGGVAVDKVAGTTRGIMNAVSFPRVVTELINGVFKALSDSNQQQMRAYLDLIRNVAASTEDFADANMAPARAREWLVQAFPGSYEKGGDDDAPTVQLKDGATRPSEGALRSALGLGPEDSVPDGDPETLVPLVQRTLAAQRQQMLASMVMMGMQRIVIESGRLNAAMQFHIDARSAAATDEGSTFDEHNTINASGHYGMGFWGVDASVSNTIGYVSTERNQTTDNLDASVDVNSSVELVFRTDYLPLDRMARPDQANRIRVNTINPEAETRASAAAQQARTAADAQAEATRRSALDTTLPRPAAAAPTPSPAPSAAGGASGNSQAGQAPQAGH